MLKKIKLQRLAIIEKNDPKTFWKTIKEMISHKDIKICR